MKKNLLLSSVLGCMLMAAPVSADVIGMRTAVPVGGTMSISLNENVKATLAWGDGTSQKVAFNGSEVAITVKHGDLTITTDKVVSNLFCPDCSLTELNVKQAPNLISLICAGNNLKSLDLGNNAKLQELNCEDNQLSSLSLTKCTLLTALNCSNNQLSSLSLAFQSRLKTLLCGYNKLQNLYTTNQGSLETLWCQGNKISNIGLSVVSRPTQICVFDNKLSSLNPTNLEGVKELWLDNNKIGSLDLSKSSIEVLSASNNELKLIKLDEQESKNLRAFYVDNNILLIGSLPDLYSRGDSLMDFNISNQRPYHFADKVNMNEEVMLTDLLRFNAVNTSIRPTVKWITDEGQTLVLREDYSSRNYIFNFLKPFKSISAVVTSDKYYPNEVFHIDNLQVVDPTGIEDVATDENLKISVKSGILNVTVASHTPIRIYSVSGATVVNEVVAAGTYSWVLPTGIYVVNGHKVVLNH